MWVTDGQSGGPALYTSSPSCCVSRTLSGQTGEVWRDETNGCMCTSVSVAHSGGHRISGGVTVENHQPPRAVREENLWTLPFVLLNYADVS